MELGLIFVKRFEWLLLVILITLFFNGCSNKEIVADRIYVPDGYQEKLSQMGLTEVHSFPYFTQPFLTVAKDGHQNEYAVAFYSDNKIDKFPLRLSYEEILYKYESYGYSVKNDINNLHLFFMNNQIIWSYNGNAKQIRLNVLGELQ
jgi:hypothetical protein